jgi:hypothetical protein
MIELLVSKAKNINTSAQMMLGCFLRLETLKSCYFTLYRSKTRWTKAGESTERDGNIQLYLIDSIRRMGSEGGGGLFCDYECRL